jgi:signal transduction histidine kinase
MVVAVRHSAERARDLTRQLLAFSRKQFLELKSVDLAQVVSGFRDILRRSLREDIELEVGLPERPLPVRADPGQLEQVLMNLALNSQDAMPGGGKLAVRAWEEVLQETRPAEFRALAPGAYVVLEVGDSGAGMDGPTLERIFEPFFTTKEKGRGTGLGLPMVYGIVKQHGGEVLVRSARGGAPAHPAAARREPPPLGPGSGPTGRPPAAETILLAEDDPAVRNARLILGRRGYKCWPAPAAARPGPERGTAGRRACWSATWSCRG